MKSLSDFRRRLTLSANLSIEHRSDIAKYSLPPQRKSVIHVQSNAVVFGLDGLNYENPRRHGNWFYFDEKGSRAANWSFPDADTAVLNRPGSSDNCKIIFRFPRAADMKDVA